MSEEIYDLTIIGGGPAGMFASFYAGLREMKVQVIESLEQFGGQVDALYPEKHILDVAGSVNIPGHELIINLEEQMRLVKVEARLGETVEDVIKQDDQFEIVTDKRTTHSKTVIIALGNGAFNPRKLAVDGADELENKHLFYFIKQKEHFRNKRVLVAGGGDAALDLTMMLEPVASQVYLMHRRETFRGLEHMVTAIEKSSVQLEVPYLLKDLKQNADESLELTMKKMKSDDTKQLTVDDIVVSYGFTSNNKALTAWSLDLESERHDIKVGSEMMTNIDGVYAIGDGVIYPGKVKLIATAFGEGPTAVTAIMNKLYPDKNSQLHSTAMHLDQK